MTPGDSTCDLPPLLFMHFPPLHAFSLVSLIHFGLTLLNLESKLNIQTVKKHESSYQHLNLKWNGSQIPTQHETYSCCWLVIIPLPSLHIPHIAAAHSNSALVERCCQGDAEKRCWKTFVKLTDQTSLAWQAVPVGLRDLLKNFDA
jgi:hypothetical protein